jgi:malonate-semialdehyde dehydrogenase (acetylating)/methylmalonate-semialdehyde dehydrogenase
LNTTARAKAEQLSADWKGTSLVGGTTKNYIGGKFVESKAENWLEIHDPVCSSGIPSSRPVP